MKTKKPKRKDYRLIKGLGDCNKCCFSGGRHDCDVLADNDFDCYDGYFVKKSEDDIAEGRGIDLDNES